MFAAAENWSRLCVMIWTSTELCCNQMKAAFGIIKLLINSTEPTGITTLIRVGIVYRPTLPFPTYTESDRLRQNFG